MASPGDATGRAGGGGRGGQRGADTLRGDGQPPRWQKEAHYNKLGRRRRRGAHEGRRVGSAYRGRQRVPGLAEQTVVDSASGGW